MTKDAANQVLKILVQADGGCPTCAAELVRLFIRAFPGHGEIIKRVWRETFDEEWKGEVA